MVNLGDIVKATGYSKATVPRVLSGEPSFTAKESTRRRTIQVVNERVPRLVLRSQGCLTKFCADSPIVSR